MCLGSGLKRTSQFASQMVRRLGKGKVIIPAFSLTCRLLIDPKTRIMT